MSNSSLVSFTQLSPNCGKPRNHKIDTVSIHCTAGNKNNTAKQIATMSRFINYDPENGASCNYAIGGDGSIALVVDEANRSWCTSSRANDNRAITIEVASNISGSEVNEAAYEALILLLTDICKRNNIKKLLWKDDKSLIGQVEQQNMTVHRWFANKACPGEYLYSRHAEIAQRVNANLEEDDDMDVSKLTDEQLDQLWARLEGRLAKRKVSDYAEESSRKAVASGLFSDGDKDGMVDNPRGVLLRQDLAVVLNRKGLLDK